MRTAYLQNFNPQRRLNLVECSLKFNEQTGEMATVVVMDGISRVDRLPSVLFADDEELSMGFDGGDSIMGSIVGTVRHSESVASEAT